MNGFKYEEDSNFSASEILSSLEPPSTSAGITTTPEPKLNLLDGTFFSYIPEKSTANKIVAICMVCRPRHVEVKGYGNCSSNFLSHLKRRHGEDTIADYRNYIRCKKSRYSKQNEETPKTPSSEMTMPMIVKGTTDSLNFRTEYGDQFEENIYRFFISAMIPPSAIENPYFSKMFEVPNPDLQPLTQKNMEMRIKENFAIYVDDIKYRLSELDFICTTVHIWTGEKENFIGVTANWITQDLRRVSQPLACRGIKCRNYNAFRISQVVREINEDFGITSHKLIGTVMGNGSDYVWSFKVFGVQLTNIVMTEQLDLEDYILFDADDANLYEDPSSGTLTDFPPDMNDFHIPLKCCANVLITAITNAIREELNYSNNSALSNIHATTINKCNILWQAAGNPMLSKIIENHIGIMLKRPEFTNWKSLNSALQQILDIKDKSSILHKALNLQNPISDSEFFYLQEYLICTAPIVEALDILKSNQNTFYGIVMPCLFALMRNLTKVTQKTQFYYCEKLINSYREHVNSAFREFFDLNAETAKNAAFAALSFPRFKNQWLVCVPPTQRNEILNAFKQIVSKEINMKHIFETQSIERNNRENDFFNFEPDLESEKNTIQSTLDAPFRRAEAQVLQFFAEESTDIEILYGYPEIKKVFLKYNAPLPSLATGENLFPSTTMNEFRRNHKSFNELMEKRIILNSSLKLNTF